MKRLGLHLVAVLTLVVAGLAPGLATAQALRITHLADRTVAEVGRTRIIAFSVDPVPEEYVELTAHVEPTSGLEIVQGPSVTAGSATGYVRVRGRTAGAVDLHVGEAVMTVNVRERAEPPRGRLQVIGPADGAVVWGTITVGVEMRAAEDGPLAAVRLSLPDGELEPIGDTGRAILPHRRLTFELDTSRLPVGPAVVLPVSTDAAGRRTTGPPVQLRVARGDELEMTEGEAEAPYEVERPERFADARRTIGRDRGASEGKYFNNAAANPVVCFPIEVTDPGWYQVMLVAGATSAQSALPTVGIVVDGGQQSTTNGRLLAETWHRLAIGLPFRLEAGSHVLSPYFANDFYAPGLVDRNLRLDRIEVARVGDGLGAPDAAPAMMMDAAAPTMMMMGQAAAGGAMIDDPYGQAAAPLRIGFARVLDGGALPGLIEIEGRLWWRGLERERAPLVTLHVNGMPVMQERSGAPRFWVDPSHFVAGANTFRMEAALDSGETVATPVQTMWWPEVVAAGQRLAPRAHRRFSIHEDGWGDTLKDRLRNQHNPKERRAAAFASNGEAVLELPADVRGPYDVFLELRGDAHEGPAKATVRLRTDGEPAAVGTIDAPGWWDLRRAGRVEVTDDAHELVVAFENDHYEQGKGDRNLWIQSVILARQPEDEADIDPPFVEIDYPGDDAPIYGADAIVATAADNASLASAELILDGMHTGMTTSLNLQPGRVVFPLLLRTLEPGAHTIAVEATDVAGNATMSETRTVRVLADAPARPTRYARAVHLLDRFAYGPDQHELAALLTMGESAWLADRLAAPLENAGDLAAWQAGLVYFVERNPYQVAGRAISHVLLTPNPVRARFVLWAQNHFSTWIRKTDGDRKWEEHVTFSRLGVAPFADLLEASAQSPAMLGYLDQQTSYAGRINENYAREIMELHCLGVDGGYSQADVTSLARLLTGWTVALEGDGRGGGPGARRYTFRFDPRLNDGDEHTVLGMRFDEASSAGRYDRIRTAIELLAAHPSTARHVSRRLAEHYVSVPPPPELVEALTVRFLETGGDMRAMLVTIAEHPSFWTECERGRLTQPLDFAARLSRTTRNYHPWRVGDYLRRSGTGLFDRPTPDGYPQEDVAYADSNAMTQRWRLAQDAMWQLVAFVPGGWNGAAGLSDERWANLAIDAVAVRLTGRVLSERSHAAALELLAASKGQRYERLRALAPFIAQLPEANLR